MSSSRTWNRSGQPISGVPILSFISKCCRELPGLPPRNWRVLATHNDFISQMMALAMAQMYHGPYFNGKYLILNRFKPNNHSTAWWDSYGWVPHRWVFVCRMVENGWEGLRMVDWLMMIKDTWLSCVVLTDGCGSQWLIEVITDSRCPSYYEVWLNPKPDSPEEPVRCFLKWSFSVPQHNCLWIVVSTTHFVLASLVILELSAVFDLILRSKSMQIKINVANSGCAYSQ